MDPAILLIMAGIFAMIALPFVAFGLAFTTRQLIAAQGYVAKLQREVANREAALDMISRMRAGDRFNLHPGTVSVSLVLTIRESWRAAGFDVAKEKALRLVSIAHRVMCEMPPPVDAGDLFNDGDRSAPAKVACNADDKDGCTFPDCQCEAVPEPPAKPPVGEKRT